MRSIKFLLPALLLISVAANGQSRVSAGVDWKIRKGLHLDAGYEMRLSDDCSSIERNQLGVGIQYSPFKHFDVGAGYSYIGHYDDEGTLKPRHRVYLDVMGSYKFGSWKVSLKERLQLTHKSYDFNEFQQTPNLVELKSRLKVAYKGFAHLDPYAYVELKNCFNGPSFETDSGYKFLGYYDAYLNRTRLALGVEWNISGHHAIDFRFMGDFCRNKDIDVNAEGTKLKSYSLVESFRPALCAGYVFSF